MVEKSDILLLFVCINIYRIILVKQVDAVDDRKCLAALHTMRTVKKCPLNLNDIKEASKRYECDIKALRQNCTEPDNFKYHCVVNGERTALVEVCAPERRINGFCAEFNSLGARIQDQYSAECRPLCPDHYQSTDAYKYADCYNLTFALNHISTTSSIYHQRPELKDDTMEFRNLLITILCLVIVVVLLIPVVIWIILKRTEKKSGYMNDDHEMETL